MATNIFKVTELGLFQLQILLMLTDRPLHGYELKKAFKELRGHELSSGMLYPTLRKLEARGYIKGEWVKKGKRKKRLYYLTDKGWNELKKLLDIYLLSPLENLWSNFQGFWEALLSDIKISKGDRVLCSAIFPLSLARWLIRRFPESELHVLVEIPAISNMLPGITKILRVMERYLEGAAKYHSSLPNMKFSTIICVLKPPQVSMPLEQLFKRLDENAQVFLVLTKSTDNIWIQYFSNVLSSYNFKVLFSADEILSAASKYSLSGILREEKGLIVAHFWR